MSCKKRYSALLGFKSKRYFDQFKPIEIPFGGLAHVGPRSNKVQIPHGKAVCEEEQAFLKADISAIVTYLRMSTLCTVHLQIFLPST